MLTIDEYMALRRLLESERESEGSSLSDRRAEQSSSPKKKRKVTKYQKELGIQWKKLKEKHPRTPAKKLLKRAHSATKKVMKKRI